MTGKSGFIRVNSFSDGGTLGTERLHAVNKTNHLSLTDVPLICRQALAAFDNLSLPAI